MKKILLGGVIGLAIFAIIEWRSANRYNSIQRRIDIEGCLNDASFLQLSSDEFFRLYHRHPTTIELQEMLTNVYNSWPLETFTEFTPDAAHNWGNRMNFSSSLTGEGGWFYDTNTGAIAINVTNAVVLGKKFGIDSSISIIPSRIKFTPLPTSSEIDELYQLHPNGIIQLSNMVESMRDRFLEIENSGRLSVTNHN